MNTISVNYTLVWQLKYANEYQFTNIMNKETQIAINYFNEQVGHFTDLQKVAKIKEEVIELHSAVVNNTNKIEECSDVLTVAFHIAVRNGFEGTPDDLFYMAYEKMKRRIESGEKDYKNGDF